MVVDDQKFCLICSDVLWLIVDTNASASVEFAVNRLFKGEAKPPAAAVLAELGKDVRPDYVTLLPEGHVEVTTSP